MTGATSSSMNARIVSRSRRCSFCLCAYLFMNLGIVIVAASIRRKATRLGLDPDKRANADRAAAYDIAREYLSAQKVLVPMIEQILSK